MQEEPAKLQRIAAGETLHELQASKSVTETNPLDATSADSDQRRPFGLCKGEFVVPDDFEDPLPDWLLDAFEGKEDDF